MARETWVQSQVESYQRLKKMVLDASLLSTQHYKVRIKGKVEQSRKGVAPSPTYWCSSYRKGSLRVTLDYGRQLYLLIYIWDIHGVMVIVVRKCTQWLKFKLWKRLFAFPIVLKSLGKVLIQLFSVQLWINIRTRFSSLTIVWQLV